MNREVTRAGRCLSTLLLPKCAGGVRKDEWADDGEIKGAEDGLTGPAGRRKEHSERVNTAACAVM